MQPCNVSKPRDRCARSVTRGWRMPLDATQVDEGHVGCRGHAGCQPMRTPVTSAFGRAPQTTTHKPQTWYPWCALAILSVAHAYSSAYFRPGLGAGACLDSVVQKMANHVKVQMHLRCQNVWRSLLQCNQVRGGGTWHLVADTWGWWG